MGQRGLALEMTAQRYRAPVPAFVRPPGGLALRSAGRMGAVRESHDLCVPADRCAMRSARARAWTSPGTGATGERQSMPSPLDVLRFQPPPVLMHTRWIHLVGVLGLALASGSRRPDSPGRTNPRGLREVRLDVRGARRPRWPS